MTLVPWVTSTDRACTPRLARMSAPDQYPAAAQVKMPSAPIMRWLDETTAAMREQRW